MNNIQSVLLGLSLPFMGTVLGAGMVFFMKKEIRPNVQKALLGFASGVMIAASVWSLIIPSIEMAEKNGNKAAWLPSAIGFTAGIAFLLLLDSLIPHLHINSDKPEGTKSGLQKSVMLILAVTLHNIPEGMAIGVVFAGMVGSSPIITVASAFALAIGIAVQNFPEGAIISMPLMGTGISKRKAFVYGAMSGIVEPIGAIVTILLTSLIMPILPYILSFAAGAMFYVVIEELIPEAQSGEHSNTATIGAGMVFFMKKEIRPNVQKALLGFASGVMIAASVWSLIIPSIEMAEKNGNKAAWLPSAIGFTAGIAFLLLLDSLIPHLHINSDKPEGTKSGLQKSVMLILAVTLHNIPEGMAIGVVFAGMVGSSPIITVASAFALAIGIAVQNFPEGAIISMPLMGTGISKRKAFVYGAMSGIVEPIGAIVTILLTSLIMPILPYILSFAAGAMFYVVIEELIPEAQSGEHSNTATIGAAIGFVLMMILDVALG